MNLLVVTLIKQAFIPIQLFYFESLLNVSLKAAFHNTSKIFRWDAKLKLGKTYFNLKKYIIIMQGKQFSQYESVFLTDRLTENKYSLVFHIT